MVLEFVAYWPDSACRELNFDSSSKAKADSGWIAYRTSLGELVIARMDGNLKRHISTKAGVANFVWSPDGDWLLFDDQSYYQIYRVQSNGDNLQAIIPTNTSIVGAEPQVSPDGHWIYFLGTKGDGPDEVYRIEWDGFNPQKVTSLANFNDPKGYTEVTNFKLSPDGRSILIQVIVGQTTQQYYVLHLPTRGLTKLFEFAIQDGLYIFGWTPDSQWVTVVIQEQLSLLMARSNGNDIHEFPIEEPTHIQSTAWSQDMRWLYFMGWEGSDTGLFRVHSNGQGIEQLVTENSGGFIIGNPQLSMGGRWLAIGMEVTLPSRGYTRNLVLVKEDGTEKRIVAQDFDWKAAWQPPLRYRWSKIWLTIAGILMFSIGMVGLIKLSHQSVSLFD
ncbi:MAG: PD40 domain-containing protein [Chloroflexi bacterium]|nr:PD40 domain-containing protein [Chloroflexota bacterium]